MHTGLAAGPAAASPTFSLLPPTGSSQDGGPQPRGSPGGVLPSPKGGPSGRHLSVNVHTVASGAGGVQVGRAVSPGARGATGARVVGAKSNLGSQAALHASRAQAGGRPAGPGLGAAVPIRASSSQQMHTLAELCPLPAGGAGPAGGPVVALAPGSPLHARNPGEPLSEAFERFALDGAPGCDGWQACVAARCRASKLQATAPALLTIAAAHCGDALASA
jgi:hypothetical protein